MEAGCPPYTRCTCRNDAIEIVVPNEAFRQKKNCSRSMCCVVGGNGVPLLLCVFGIHSKGVFFFLVVFLPLPVVVRSVFFCVVLLLLRAQLSDHTVLLLYRWLYLTRYEFPWTLVDVSLGAPARPPSCVLAVPRLVQESTQG